MTNGSRPRGCAGCAGSAVEAGRDAEAASSCMESLISSSCMYACGVVINQTGSPGGPSPCRGLGAQVGHPVAGGQVRCVLPGSRAGGHPGVSVPSGALVLVEHRSAALSGPGGVVSTGRLHGFESLVEQRLLLALDFLGVVDLLARPMALKFGHQERWHVRASPGLSDRDAGRRPGDRCAARRPDRAR
jgi:hypothetical protein